MAVTNIVKIPATVLNTRCTPIKDVSPEVKAVAENLLDTIREPKTHGVGLAAPQIGQSVAICVVIKQHQNNPPVEYLMLNPKILKYSPTTDIKWEGCLSIPDTYCKVRRSKEITVEYMELSGRHVRIKATGFFARVIQHEVDHLQGVLITDKCIGVALSEKELDELLAKEKADD